MIGAGVATSALTVLTPLTASENGDNMPLMILSKILQGGFTAILPPGFNSIALGIVGSTGFTHQVSRNRMMNHIGSALVIAIGSLIAYVLYPNIGALFVVSPLATIGMFWNLIRIKPQHVDRDAARGLIIESPTMTEYEHLDTANSMEELDGSTSNTDYMAAEDDYSTPEISDSSGSQSPEVNNTTADYVPPQSIPEHVPCVHGMGMPKQLPDRNGSHNNTATNPFCGCPVTSEPPKSNPKDYSSEPSFNFGWNVRSNPTIPKNKAQSPLSVLMDQTLVIFTLVVFFFHLANSSVLPLVMQSLAVQDEQAGILLSGLCIVIAQGFMSYFAKVAGDLTPKWGRKGLVMAGLLSLTIRCILLTILLTSQEKGDFSERGQMILKALILSTQLLDSCGAGLFNCLQILITNDISVKTGRFSLMLGVTSGAMCAGATISGYIGMAIAQDYGYPLAFTCLGVMSLIPVLLFLIAMPETLPDYVKPGERRRRLLGLWRKVVEQRRKLAMRAAQPFQCRGKEKEEPDVTERLDVGNGGGSRGNHHRGAAWMQQLLKKGEIV